MAITGKIQTVFSDKARTKPVFPRTKTTAVSDETGKTLDKILEDITPSPDKIIMDDQGTNLTTKIDTLVQKSGDTMEGNLAISTGGAKLTLNNANLERGTIPTSDLASYMLYYNDKDEKNLAYLRTYRYASGKNFFQITACDTSKADLVTNRFTIGFDVDGTKYIQSDAQTGTFSSMEATFSKAHGAVWNDYAEFRSSEVLEPGRVIVETGKGNLVLATERLQPGANIISDTYGFSIGETEECRCPIAVSGRVLAYTYEDRDSYEAGDPVCAGPNGTVSKMSREEVREWPDRIIGTVSEIPTYETWGSGNVEVKNRIWVKVR